MTSGTKYNSLEMPWGVFKRALCTGDTSEIENFEEVFMDFNDSIGGPNLREELSNLKEETVLHTKVTLAFSIMDMLNREYDEEKFELLKLLGYHKRIGNVDLNDCKAYCKAIEGYVKLDLVQLKEYEKEAETKPKGKANYTLDYFMDMELEIQSALNIKIEDTSTVRYYCRAVVKYRNYIDLQNKRNEAEQKKQFKNNYI